MCDVSASPEQIAGAIPRAATGLAVDPIALEPADEVVITTLVDNVYDALLPGDERVARPPFSAGTARAPQFESGSTNVGLMAEHGFSVIERREPSLLVDHCVLVTGEVDRTTEFEHGMPPAHQAWTGSAWRHDPLVIDDQAVVVHLRGRASSC